MTLHHLTIVDQGEQVSINGFLYDKKDVYISVTNFYRDSKENIEMVYLGFMKEGSHDMLGHRIKQTESASVAKKVLRDFQKKSGITDIKEIYSEITI